MMRIFLQSMVEDIPDDQLPAQWSDFDLTSFSAEKTLWDYQQKALQNAVKLLWKYYEEFADYHPDEDLCVNRERKQKLWEWYLNNGLRGRDLSIDLRRMGYRIASLLQEYYETEDGIISYEQFINRMAFWMATGSGKTLVIVKLVEILWHLIRRGEIPPNDILVLTHRDDLIEQLKHYVAEFNRNRWAPHITLRELQEYPDAKRELLPTCGEHGITAFYYRSDNLSDEQKEKIVDFHNYDNEGRWYILLDEAHKGDKEESKRQHIYSILSRNGFLFNFSATFTDDRDIATTVFNFNLSEYIRKGYGKHIAIMKQEMRAFRDKEDYTGEEKQKVVLKALMMLTYVHMVYKDIRAKGDGLYHRPMLLVLVNSVNTEDADLQLFFRELERISKEKVSDKVWQEAKEELLQELRQQQEFVFEEESLKVDSKALEDLSYRDLLQWVFNSEASGGIEVLVRPSNRQEMAFKLKTSDRPFALVKIGDISTWLKEKLEGYEINERFEDESYFARLNEEDSDITILMGSRTFYEGWDSNRPNVICYINIGVGEDARKFILQSVGRGVRIEPVKNKRRRLLPLYNAGEVEKGLFEQFKERVKPVETLFIFGTNRQAIGTVVEGLKQEHTKTREQQLTLFEVNPEVKGKRLLIPTYKRVERPLAEIRQLAKFPFELEMSEFEVMKKFIESADDRVLLMLYDTMPKLLKVLRKSVDEPDRFYKFDGHKMGNLRLLLHRVLNYMNIAPEEVDRVKELEDEIRHFRHITVSLTEIDKLQEKAEKVKKYQDPAVMEQRLRERFKRNEISLDEYTEGIKQTARMVREEEFEYGGKRIAIKHIGQHYYLPIVLSLDEKVEYIQHIIRTESEVRFLEELEKYLSRPDSKFSKFDWWLFSKLDESLDEVYLPYYDPKRNYIARFKPDFIFWLQKGSRYFIVFVDPKGIEHVDWVRKVDGYCAVFEEAGALKVFQSNGLSVSVHLYLHTRDTGRLPEDYRKFWFDSIDQLLEDLVRIS